MTKFQERKKAVYQCQFGVFMNGTTWMPFGHNNEGIQEDYAVTKD